jgi:hypothetical protein
VKREQAAASAIASSSVTSMPRAVVTFFVA